MRQLDQGVFLGRGARPETWDVAIQPTVESPLATIEEVVFGKWPEIYGLLDEHAIAVATIMALSSAKGAAALTQVMDGMTAAAFGRRPIESHSAYLTAAVGDFYLTSFEPWSRWGHSASRTQTGPGVRRSTWYDGNMGWWRPAERDWFREMAAFASKGKGMDMFQRHKGKGKGKHQHQQHNQQAPVSQGMDQTPDSQGDGTGMDQQQRQNQLATPVSEGTGGTGIGMDQLPQQNQQTAPVRQGDGTGMEETTPHSQGDGTGMDQQQRQNQLATPVSEGTGMDQQKQQNHQAAAPVRPERTGTGMDQASPVSQGDGTGMDQQQKQNPLATSDSQGGTGMDQHATPVSQGEGTGMGQAANAEPPEAAVPSWLSVD